MRRLLVLALLVLACAPKSDTRKARETALQHDLFEMRKAIADFRADKKRGPHSLEELTTAKYLRNIPKDPITESANWRVTTEAAVRNDDFASSTTPAPEPEVIDVHSRAAGRDSAGKLYSDY